ncbi:GGDEF domain-containing response regulator [Actimicrobium antarcticum]|uniref:Diguanylate cyclase response regulator n=1 Tax=Actimicrobium antarcticum TaxID=1051899 RepID=A0ABP7SWC0_9BURK
MLSAQDLYAAKILVVDDNRDNVNLLLAILEQEGYSNLDSTTSSLEVVARHKINHYDLIMLDIQMPLMDGFKVMDELRKLEQDAWLPVLAITAQPEHKNTALEAGAKDFISKPFDVVEIIQRIRNMLEVRLHFKNALRNNAELHRLALHDSLTGLPNRRLLEDRISTAIEHAKRKRTHVAVMYIDLDGFKEVNDTLGHESGDSLLQLVSERLINASRGEDTVARIGGDEFMVVLGELNVPEDIHGPAQKILEEVARPYLINDVDVTVTTSIGISIYPFDAASVEMMMSTADQALYEAKRNGRNCYHVASLEPVANQAGSPAAPVKSAPPVRRDIP